MYDVRDPYRDDEDEQARVLRQLLGADEAQPSAAVDVAVERKPSVSMSADEFPLPEEHVSTVGRDETSPAKQEDKRSLFSDWDTLAALVLDAGMNKGRGIGQIAGAYAANRSAAERQKEQHQLHLDEIAARKASDPFAQALALRRVEVAEGNLGTRKDEGGRAQQRLTDTESRYKESVPHAQELAAAGVRGREVTKNELKDTSADTAETIAEARAGGSTRGATNELADNPRAVTKEEEIRNNLAQRQLEESERGRSVTEAAAAETRRNREMDTFRESNKTLIDAALKAKELQAQIDKAHGGDVPGLGFMDRNLPSWAGASDEDVMNRKLYSAVTNPEIKRMFGANVTANETGRGNEQFSTGPFATERDQLAAFKIMRDAIHKQIAINAAGKEDIAREVLTPGGLADLIAAPNPAAGATPQARPAAVDPLAGARELPVTGGRSAKLPGFDTSEQAKPFNLRSPSGQTGVRSFTPSALQQWLDAHPGWEVF